MERLKLPKVPNLLARAHPDKLIQLSPPPCRKGPAACPSPTQTPPLQQPCHCMEASLTACLSRDPERQGVDPNLHKWPEFHSLKHSACPSCPSSRDPHKQVRRKPGLFSSPLAARKPIRLPASPVTQSGRVWIPSSINSRNVKSLKYSACLSYPSSRDPHKRIKA
ncbi:uncharacterized protein [Manis javanica]|uniref:uncharacterized protein isoform X1 n=1 Tax=Manis javanica TaxID=9974 RepID=UPI003C6D98D9